MTTPTRTPAIRQTVGEGAAGTVTETGVLGGADSITVDQMAAALIEVFGETPPWWQVRPNDPSEAARAWRRIAIDVLRALRAAADGSAS